MNRRKKINQTLKGKAKKANAKKAGSNKPKYISKADRTIEEQGNQPETVNDNQNNRIESATENVA